MCVCVFVLVLVVVLVMYYHQPAETVVGEESIWEDGLGHLNDAVYKCTGDFQIYGQFNFAGCFFYWNVFRTASLAFCPQGLLWGGMPLRG